MGGFDYISACYAMSVAAGGIIGYVKAGSTNSLIAGLAFGGLLAFGTYQTTVDPTNFTLSLCTATVLAVLMGYRFYSSGKIMPAGLVMVLSGVIMLRFMIRHVLLMR